MATGAMLWPRPGSEPVDASSRPLDQIRSPMDASMQVLDIALEILLVIRTAQAIHARCGFAFKRVERCPE